MIDMERLNTEIRSVEDAFGGAFFARVIDLGTNEEFCLREREVLPTASTFKLCVLCELFRQARCEGLDLSAAVTWRPEHRRTGDGVLRTMVGQQHLSVHNMAVLMMTLSDNVATAVLVELVGPDKETAFMHSLGLADTNIHEGLPGGERVHEMEQPQSTPHDLCELVARVYRHQVLTPEDCDEVVRIMRASRCNDMLPRYVPVGEDWGDAADWIANKTGYGRCRIEVGLVHRGGTTIALAMFYRPAEAIGTRFKCLADYPPVLAMANACRIVAAHFAPKPPT